MSERVGAKRKAADYPAEVLVWKKGFDDEGMVLICFFFLFLFFFVLIR